MPESVLDAGTIGGLMAGLLGRVPVEGETRWVLAVHIERIEQLDDGQTPKAT
ncbi:MAG: hypothetical protein ACI8W8_002512 [Rhodothermales bacterium]|jgi:hypothetical protein